MNYRPIATIDRRHSGVPQTQALGPLGTNHDDVAGHVLLAVHEMTRLDPGGSAKGAVLRAVQRTSGLLN